MTKCRPYILFEHDVGIDGKRLDQAWRRPDTFAFVAAKCGVPTNWIEKKLGELPSDLCDGHFILLTSGSTGHPKLVVGRRDRAERLVEVLHQLQESEPVHETVCALLLTYSYAFINQWLWTHKYQRRLVITPGLAQPGKLKQALEATTSAMICLVGSQVPMLAEYFSGCTFPGVIRVHFAGGRFPQERLDTVRKLFPQAVIFNNFGCAEAMPRLTLRRADVAPIAHHIGWPLPGIEMKSDDDSRIWFRSPYGAVALLDESGCTLVKESTWVSTGDLGRALEDGHWELLGREGEVFKRYGEKVSLPQILSSVQVGWRGQADCYRETDARGEAGYVLVLAPRPTDDEARELLKAISFKHSRPHWPLRLESVEAMPLLSNGKINREGLVGRSDTRTHWKQRI